MRETWKVILAETTCPLLQELEAWFYAQSLTSMPCLNLLPYL